MRRITALGLGVVVAGAMAGCGEPEGPEPWTEAEFLKYVDSRSSGLERITNSDQQLIKHAQGLCETEFEEYGPQGWYDLQYRSSNEISLGGDYVRDSLHETLTMMRGAARTYCPEYVDEVKELNLG